MANSQTVMAVIKSARPKFRNNHDKIAFAIHSSFLASGYDLIATGPPAFADDALSSSPTKGDVGIEGWNEYEGEYAFVYKKPERGCKKILVKCLVMDDKLLVDAVAFAAAEPSHLEILVGMYTNDSIEENNYALQYKDLNKLVSDLQSKILDGVDDVVKPSSSRTQTSFEEEEEERRYYERDLLGSGPRFYPGVVVPPIPGGDGGFSDLHPGPGAGMYPGRGGFGDGSMLIGPSDPRFFRPFGDQSPIIGPPQPGVPPPGARFDPYGPPDVPGFEPGRFIRHPPRRSGHPDLEQFPGGSDFI